MRMKSTVLFYLFVLKAIRFQSGIAVETIKRSLKRLNKSLYKCSSFPKTLRWTITSSIIQIIGLKTQIISIRTESFSQQKTINPAEMPTVADMHSKKSAEQVVNKEASERTVVSTSAVATEEGTRAAHVEDIRKVRVHPLEAGIISREDSTKAEAAEEDTVRVTHLLKSNEQIFTSNTSLL